MTLVICKDCTNSQNDKTRKKWKINVKIAWTKNLLSILWNSKPNCEKNKNSFDKTLINGPSCTGKTYHKTEKLKTIFDRNVFIICRSPEQYKDATKTEEETVKKVNMKIVTQFLMKH